MTQVNSSGFLWEYRGNGDCIPARSCHAGTVRQKPAWGGQGGFVSSPDHKTFPFRSFKTSPEHPSCAWALFDPETVGLDPNDARSACKHCGSAVSRYPVTDDNDVGLGHIP